MGDYFGAMRIPLGAGRDFTAEDREGAPLVGIVNESFARTYFPGASPLGARFRWAREEGPPHWITIVGVVGDVRHFGLEQPDEPAVYLPYAQSLQPWKRWMDIVVRSPDDVAAITAIAKREVRKVDALVPVSHIRSMADIMRASTAPRRFNMLLLSVFASVALILACVGIYGVISSAVAQRTHEFGIRIALGAGRGQMLKLVLGQGAVLVSCGLGLGLCASLVLTRLMRGLLFGVTPHDPATLAGVTALLAAVALLASYLPARRAINADPIRALHYQ
jgi:putative ABC transport system permease protein